MNQKQLEEIVKIVKSDMDKLNIPYKHDVPVVVNRRLSRALGRCTFRCGQATLVELSEVIIASELQELKNTICHELIHTACPQDHHGGMWLVYANKMTHNSNYTITRLHDVSVLNQNMLKAKRQPYKYKVTCRCGCSMKMKRKTDFIKSIEKHNGESILWRCSKCGADQWTLETL